MSSLPKYLSQNLVSMACIVQPTSYMENKLQKVCPITVEALYVTYQTPPQSTDCMRPAAAILTTMRNSISRKWSSSSETTVE